MIHRTSGEMLATSDRVAMMPTVQPAAAGTQASTGGGPGRHGEGHRPRGYSLTRSNGCEKLPDRTCVLLAGPWPGSSGTALDSRNASCSVFSPSRTGPACGPRYSADAVTSPASAVINRRASSRSRCGLSSGSSADSPSFSAAALISITADRVITSTAGISASSRAGGSAASEDGAGSSVMPARLACATVPANARDSKWSPTPTVGHNGSAVRSQASPVLRCPGSVGIGPCFEQGPFR